MKSSFKLKKKKKNLFRFGFSEKRFGYQGLGLVEGMGIAEKLGTDALPAVAKET